MVFDSGAVLLNGDGSSSSGISLVEKGLKKHLQQCIFFSIETLAPSVIVVNCDSSGKPVYLCIRAEVRGLG
jgi:hypothetical protein